MLTNVSLKDLMEYTEWERQKWYDWLRQHGEQVLKTSAGPHGDGRFGTVGEVMRHIFAAEKRYVEWLGGRTLTDPASIPNDNIEGLFQFGQQSRKDLRQFIETFPEQEWDAEKEIKFPNRTVGATPRKIVIHILLHEIRHWAQIATVFRFSGLTGEFHDFLFSPVLGGELRREQAKA